MVVGASRVVWFSASWHANLSQPHVNQDGITCMVHSVHCLCPGCPDKKFSLCCCDMDCHRRSSSLRRFCDIFRGKLLMTPPSLVWSPEKLGIWDCRVLLWEVHFTLIIHSITIYWVSGMCQTPFQGLGYICEQNRQK